jgi:hypothetical protein
MSLRILNELIDDIDSFLKEKNLLEEFAEFRRNN